MQIKPSEGASVAPPPSTRPAAVGQLTSEARASVVVSLSSTVRALAATLTQELLDSHGLRVDDTLTHEDHLMLARASEFASGHGLDPSELRKLVLDLASYRAQADAQPSQRPQLLALPSFSARDEALARMILSSGALRSTAVDRGFVRALLDPDRRPEHSVDFEFLRRVVVALSALPADANFEQGAAFERRDARAALARAIEALKLPRGELTVSPTLDAAHALAALTRDDRAVLGALYAAASARGEDLGAVDDVARALVRLRELERSEIARGALSPAASPRDASPAAGGLLAPALHEPELAPPPPAAAPAIAASSAPGEDASEQAVPGLVRNFGSATQLATRASGTYRSLAPPGMPYGGPFPGGSEDLASAPSQLARAQRASAAPTMLARPLDLAVALGLSTLVRDVRAEALHAARARLPARPAGLVRPIEAPRQAAGEAEADDPDLDSSPGQRRVRWQLLLSRRKRARPRAR